jgi:hypothetical protein
MAQIPVDIPILDGLGGQILGDDNGPIYLTVGYTATEVSGTFDDLTPFSSRPFIFTDQSISDVDPQTMPTNLVWEDDAPVGNVDWSFFTSAVTGFNTPRWSGRGANLISPSYAFVAEHAIGSGPYYWVQPDGTEIARTRVAAWHLIDIAFGPPPAVSDFTIIKLDTPITAIKPVPILEDSSLVADEPALIVEMNRQISTHLLANTLSNANHRTDFQEGTRANRCLCY